MAIKVIRICNICERECPQNITEEEKEVSYPIDFVCSDCVLQTFRLMDLKSVENDGRGIRCVGDIIHFLVRGDGNKAKAIYQNDGDKIISYPKIQEWMEKNFGCRTHLKKDCQNPLCKSLRPK